MFNHTGKKIESVSGTPAGIILHMPGVIPTFTSIGQLISWSTATMPFRLHISHGQAIMQNTCILMQTAAF
ncbi:MAG: hypothetical protein AMS23_02715 [Bacteroides sp. SM1_62]|nr:MAG: hypothetical protein AMS23_02715 [Bacteroides sp. SM1_62]